MRMLTALLLTALSTPALAVDLFGPEGFEYDIDESDTLDINNGTIDSYDSWPRMCVLLDPASMAECEAARSALIRQSERFDSPWVRCIEVEVPERRARGGGRTRPPRCTGCHSTRRRAPTWS